LLTRELDIQLLWIDALCIVQDDANDWHEESAKMKGIYGKAALVISADRASSCEEGFLTDRREYGRTVDIPVRVEQCVEAFLSPIEAYSVHYEREIVKHIDKDTSMAMHRYFAPQGTESIRMARVLGLSNHTMSRAWCLQESMLASRVVHFTPSEMVWECVEDVSCECAGFDTLKAMGAGYPRKLGWTQMIHSGEIPHVLSAWWSCVQQYNIRSLTKETDKLSAISGLAHQMPTELLGNYYAGIWEVEFPQGLLWETVGEEYDNTSAIRPQSYVAPSWSWLSISHTGVKREFDMKPFAKVVNISCENVAASKFGPLKSASLVLETVSFRVHCIGNIGDINSKEMTRHELEALQVPRKAGVPFTFVVYGDHYQKGKTMFGHIFANIRSRDRVVGRVRPGGKFQDIFKEYTFKEFGALDLRCVLVGRDISDYGNDIYGCLLVKPSLRLKGAFERVGTLRITFDKPWDLPGVKRSEITLV
jgi:Heterokaryon incompatibility protein (HET)